MTVLVGYVGMPGALFSPFRRLVGKQEQKVIAGFRDAGNGCDHRLFSRVIVPTKLSRMGRVILRVLGRRYGDFRDWRATDAWAEQIARQLIVSAGAR